MSEGPLPSRPESAYRSGGNDDTADYLLDTTRRYRIDTEKVQKAVAQEFTAKTKEESEENGTRREHSLD